MTTPRPVTELDLAIQHWETHLDECRDCEPGYGVHCPVSWTLERAVDRASHERVAA